LSDYLVIYEEGPNSWGAYVPDLPGCFAVGDTREDAEGMMGETIATHIEGYGKMGCQFLSQRCFPGR